jgi:hypothetical protein
MGRTVYEKKLRSKLMQSSQSPQVPCGQYPLPADSIRCFGRSADLLLSISYIIIDSVVIKDVEEVAEAASWCKMSTGPESE